MSASIKIIYIPAQFRVRVELTRARCLASDAPPEDLLRRAKAKLRREVKQGRVAFFRIFKTRLERMWRLMRSDGLPDDATVALTLVTGCPPMPGIVVGPPSELWEAARLSFTARPELVTTWRFELVKMAVGRYMRRLGLTAVADPACIHGMWLRASHGDVVQEVPLRRVPPYREVGQDADPYDLNVDAFAGDVVLVVFDVRPFRDRDVCNSVLQEIRKRVAKLGESRACGYALLERHVAKTLASANRGPEAYGLDLPLAILAATPTRATDPLKPPIVFRPMRALPGVISTPWVVKAPARPTSAHLATDVVIETSADGMCATIVKFSTTHFDRGSRPTSADWERRIKISGVVHGMTDGLFEQLEEAWRNRKDLTGICVAKGTPGVAGKAPFLEETHKNPGATSGTQSLGFAGMRDRQQRRIVAAGQMIARVTFATPPIMGKDVRGHDRPAPEGEALAVTVGEGVTQRSDGGYYASWDGVPKYESGMLSLLKAMLVQGDVNMASGTISFDGPVEISGSVEQGARIEVTGDLRIGGMISGGLVCARGSLIVAGGITGTVGARVTVGGDLTADFLENAHVTCRGSATVTKSIVGSHVIVDGEVKLQDGAIIGGKVACGKSLTCGLLGRSTGSKTWVSAGTSPRWAEAATCREQRLARLTAQLTKDGVALKELSGRHDNQMTPHHQELKTALHDRVAHLQRIVDSFAAYIQAAKARITVQEDACITVTGTLSANCRLEIAGKRVAVVTDVAGVAVAARQVKGSHLVPLVE